MRRGTPILVILTLAIFASEVLASFLGWYEQFPWFDMVMHTLGGAWVAVILLVAGGRRLPHWFAHGEDHARLFRVVAGVLLVGALWELYELGFAFYATAAFGDLGFYQGWADTLSDLALDTFGATAAGFALLPPKSEPAKIKDLQE